MTLFKPATLKQLYVLALSLAVPVLVPNVALAEKGIGKRWVKEEDQVTDLNVVTEETVKFENYFEKWSDEHSLSDRIEISSVRIGSELAVASVLGKLAHKSYLKVVGERLRSQDATFFLAKNKFAAVKPTVLGVTSVFLIVDAVNGIIVAADGHKPRYIGNTIALAQYMLESRTHPALTRRPMNSRERIEFQELERHIQEELNKKL